jgi:hypothetical protein
VVLEHVQWADDDQGEDDQAQARHEELRVPHDLVVSTKCWVKVRVEIN